MPLYLRLGLLPSKMLAHSSINARGRSSPLPPVRFPRVTRRLCWVQRIGRPALPGTRTRTSTRKTTSPTCWSTSSFCASSWEPYLWLLELPSAVHAFFCGGFFPLRCSVVPTKLSSFRFNWERQNQPPRLALRLRGSPRTVLKCLRNIGLAVGR